MDDTVIILRDKASEMSRRVDTLRKRREKLDLQIADLETKIEAVGVVLGDVLGGDSAESGRRPVAKKSTSSVGSLTDEVRAIIRALNYDFQAGDVRTALVASNPDKHSDLEERPVRKILARLAREKDIDVIQRGSGPKGSTYRLAARTDSSNAPQDQGRSFDEQIADSDAAISPAG